MAAGGSLYASGGTSLVLNTGERQSDFQLAELLGVSLLEAEWTVRDHYLAPTAAGQESFPGWDGRYPAFVRGASTVVRARENATVLATRTLPWPAPDPRGFSSSHSNPPWVATAQPAVVLNRFGRGRVVYRATLLEEVPTLRESFVLPLRRLEPSFTFEVATHPTVEVTLFHQPDRRRHLLTLVSAQEELPALPVDGTEVRLRLPQRVRSVRTLLANRRIGFRRTMDGVVFTVPRLDTLLMMAVNHA